MASPLGEVAQGYADLAASLIDEWSKLGARIADKVDEGTYGAGAATADCIAAVMLAGKTGFLVISEAFDAAATLAPRGPLTVQSDSFESPVAGAALAVAGPFTNLAETDTLPVTVIEVVPAQLAPGQTRFRVRADATGHQAGMYRGQVVATGAANPIPVVIAVQ